jgi:hypothetical protein
MALFSECSLECASKLLDTADIVREAIYLPSGIKPFLPIASSGGCE